MLATAQTLSSPRRGILTSVLAGVGRRLADARARAREVAELSGLSDRDLQDIGITRSEIPFVVRAGRRA